MTGLSLHGGNDDEDELAFRRFVEVNLDRQAYLAANPDVLAADIDPVEHWLNFGFAERRPLPGFIVLRGSGASSAGHPHPYSRFRWRGEPVAVRAESEDEMAFRRFAEVNLDRKDYLSANPDVAAAGVDPVEHWLNAGFTEGRTLRGFSILKGANAAKAPSRPNSRFRWRGETFVIVEAVASPLIEQVLRQSRHDPAVVAPGALALSHLRQFDAIDLWRRDGIEFRLLLEAIPTRPDVIVMMPYLLAGGAEKYAADLVSFFITEHRSNVLVLVTEQREEEAAGWEKHAILASFNQTKIVFWRSFCAEGARGNHHIVAGLVNALRPRHLVVINSRLGLEMVSRHGRAISQSTKLACTYFSLNKNALGAPFGARFPRHTMPFSVTVTDNAPMAATLSRLYVANAGHPIVVVPPRVPLTTSDHFADRLSLRRKRQASENRIRKWLWASRLAPFKGVDVLSELARLRPDDCFDVFGPLNWNWGELDLDLDNVRYKGPYSNLDALQFESYDGFVFTSSDEGMPNVVLEISQYAIPMALTDVGGLKDTFDDNAVLFVKHQSSSAETARLFQSALDRILSMNVEQVDHLVSRAKQVVETRHSAAAFAAAAATAFENTQR